MFSRGIRSLDTLSFNNTDSRRRAWGKNCDWKTTFFCFVNEGISTNILEEVQLCDFWGKHNHSL